MPLFSRKSLLKSTSNINFGLEGKVVAKKPFNPLSALLTNLLIPHNGRYVGMVGNLAIAAF